MKKLLILCALLSGCTTTQPQTLSDSAITPGKTLLTIQQSIQNTRESISVPCQKGFIAQQDCKAIDSYYQQAKPVYDAAVVAVTTGDSSKYDEQRQALQSLLLNMTGLLVKYNLGGAK